MSEKFLVTINGEQFPTRCVDVDVNHPDINDGTSAREIRISLHDVEGVVAKEDLRELVEEFNEYSNGKHRNAQELAEVQTWETATNKLRELIEDE